MLWYGAHRIATAYMYPKPTEPFIFQRNFSFPNSLSRYSILSSFSLMFIISFKNNEDSGGGAAAPPPEIKKKNSFFKKENLFSKILFYLDFEN
jgi:hypothetical protein